jgi:hypothetical protein
MCDEQYIILPFCLPSELIYKYGIYIKVVYIARYNSEIDYEGCGEGAQDTCTSSVVVAQAPL